MIAKNKVTEITQIVFMVWVFVFTVYSVAWKRCLAEKPAIVESYPLRLGKLQNCE